LKNHVVYYIVRVPEEETTQTYNINRVNDNHANKKSLNCL